MVDDDPGALLYRTIGERIRTTRKARRLTQDHLAYAIGFRRTSVVNIEAGRQRLPIAALYDIADVLGVQATELLPRNEEV